MVGTPWGRQFLPKIAEGETFVVRTRRKDSLDVVITDGTTAVDTSALTGESLPFDKGVSDGVLSGTVNLSGVIRIKVTSTFKNSTVSKILELVENSSGKKSRSERFITRFAKYYTPCVVIAAVLLAAVPPLLFRRACEGQNRALIFLSSPVRAPRHLRPLSFFRGDRRSLPGRILIKGANYEEALVKAETVVFDKNGTLRKDPSVTAVHPETFTEARILDIAAAAES